MDRNTPATSEARNQAAAERSKTPRQLAEADTAREGARLGRIVAERELAVSTLETICALKAEGRPITPAMYVIGETPDGEPIDAREVIAGIRNRRRLGVTRNDGRMTAAELSAVVTAAARNVTAGINRRTAGQGKVTREDWEDLTGELTLAALAREAEAVAALRGDTLAAALRGPDARANLDTLPRWTTVQAAGTSAREAWIKVLTANEGRTWARRRAEAAAATRSMLKESSDIREAAAQEAAADRGREAAAEAREIAELAADRLGLGKQAQEAAAAALDGLTTAERAKLNGRKPDAQKQAQKNGRRILATALGGSLAAARKLATEVLAETAERPTTAAELAEAVAIAREAETDALTYLAESNRAFHAGIVAASLAAAKCEAERYVIMRAHYGAATVKVSGAINAALREIGPSGKLAKETPKRAYRPAFTTSDLAALPERTPAAGNVATLATRAMPATYGPRALPTRETCHVVKPTPGHPVKRTARREAEARGWTCEGFREATYRAEGATLYSTPSAYLAEGRPTVTLARAERPRDLAAEEAAADRQWLAVTHSA